LIEAGANMEKSSLNDDQVIPIFEAVRRGYKPLCEKFIEKKVRIDPSAAKSILFEIQTENSLKQEFSYREEREDINECIQMVENYIRSSPLQS
jgi:hypothetical protein